MSNGKPLKTRCAIYTRKSSEEGLEQEFNSLDAQREAAAAYIASQKHEGWTAIDDHFDDGGFSGGSMERPALKRLLADVQEGKIDIIVVYKIDRLTRSLSDFSRLIELFDRHNVTFVAVTQQFNTTTSMGRLTLNILLSFAQFEREVTSERIRDKFALAKKKGMWVGGRVALGYDVKNRKLVINKDEANQVRFLFELFAENHSLSETCRMANHQGLRTKAVYRDGVLTQGGKRWNRAVLYRLLRNRLYRGEIGDKKRGKWYPGEHKAIVGEDLWNRVQTVFDINGKERRKQSLWKNSPAFLQGLIIGPDGLALVPSSTRRRGKQYRYYVSSKGVKENYASMALPPIPANEIEAAVIDRVGKLLATPAVISRVAQCLDTTPDTQQIATIREALTDLSALWPELYPNEQRLLVHQLLDKITLEDQTITMTFKTPALMELGAQMPEERA
jgi:site-specific DNA recombinase